MQDIMQRLGMPADGHSPFDHNAAAIALAVAMNKARLELADQNGVKAEAKTFAVARLEALRKALEPLYAAIPPEVDLFDLGLVTQERPRLFVDILAYVEMNRDQSAFRLMQETRGGRVLLAEAADERAMIDEITTYVARRLVDRERRLAMEEELPPLPQLGATDGTTEPPADDISPPEAPEPIKAELPSAMAAGRPTEAPPQPATAAALSMTAEEAFRQWTGHSQSNLARSTPTDALMDLTAATGTVTRTKDDGVSALDTEPKAVQVASAPETLAKAGSEAEEIAPKAAGPALPDRAPMIRRDESGRWFWPLFALLIGAGMGAAALYLYAASLVR
jgi:hypothetical protein